MNIACTICRDFFLPSDEIYSTQCGHVFHKFCLKNWIKNGSCPTCRKRANDTAFSRHRIRRIYLEISSDEIDLSDTVSGAQVQNLQNQVKSLQNKTQRYRSTWKDLETENEILRSINSRLLIKNYKSERKNARIHTRLRRTQKVFSKWRQRHEQEIADLTQQRNQLDSECRVYSLMLESMNRGEKRRAKREFENPENCVPLKIKRDANGVSDSEESSDSETDSEKDTDVLSDLEESLSSEESSNSEESSSSKSSTSSESSLSSDESSEPARYSPLVVDFMRIAGFGGRATKCGLRRRALRSR